MTGWEDPCTAVVGRERPIAGGRPGPYSRAGPYSTTYLEHHGLLLHRPGEVDIVEESLVRCNSVLQRALVERVGGKLREARVHAVLHLRE